MHQQISKGTSSVLESVLYIDKQRQGLTNMEGSLAFRERAKKSNPGLLDSRLCLLCAARDHLALQAGFVPNKMAGQSLFQPKITA